MKHILICRTNGTIEDMGLTKDHDLSWYAAQIDAELIQTVHARGLKRPYVMLCDEEGLLKKKPVINFIGSWLYETHKHNEPIVGDIIIMKDVIKDGETDFGGMEAGEADMMAEWLLNSFQEAYDKVMAQIGGTLIRE